MKNLFCFSIIVLIIGVNNVYGQFDISKKIKKEVEKRVNKNIDQGIDTTLNKVEKGIKGDDKKKDMTQQEDKNKKQVAEEQKSSGKETENNIQFTSSSKYDFVPGEKIILFDDFSQDAVGDFPALWTANAPGEINTLSIAPGNWFNLNSGDGNYFLLKNIDFPKNFIIEFDIVPKKTGGRIAAGLILYGEDKHKEMDNNPHPGNGGIIISIEKGGWNTLGYKTGESSNITGSSTLNPVEPEKVNHVIIWVQNRRFRIYYKEAKVLDMPTNIYDETKLNRLCFRLSRGASCGSYISNFRITDASPDMRSKLLTEGKLVSYGIYFDVNKDVVKTESYGTIKGIATILQENPTVKIKIVGHTDSDGEDKSNLDLSKRRAASVKNVLVKDFSIDAARIETDGKGEGEPIAQNDTAANKSLNRRVEFIKL
ncbi:MAG: OmpA family protein [Ignavibacteriales bacterium]|nr:OmpA family protein [Ignavibacteriales bacterium]